MKLKNWQRSSSRRKVATLTMSRALGVIVSSPMRDRWPVTEPGKRARDRLAELSERFVHRLLAHQRSIVPVRRIFFCSSSTP